MVNAAHPVGPEEVMAYLDGELTAERAAEVAKHVDGCVECKGLVRDLQMVSRRIGEWEAGACRVAAPDGKVVKRRRWWPVWVTAGVAATVVVLLVPAGLHTDYRSARALVDQVRTAAPPAFRARLKSQFNEVRVMIARTAQLSLISTDFAHARERLESILQAHHGYIGQLTMNAPTGTGRSLDAALRVPSAELDASMAELKKLGRVESETQSGEEVTQQYVDLEARIANARNTEQRLTTVLQQQTGKMQDVLDVEKEISRVRGEIETMEAERKTLSGRVEFATINIKVTEEYKAQLQAPDSIGTRLGNAAVAGYRHVADGAMGLAEFGLEYGLSIAIWMAVLFWPARWAWRHYRAG
jgi:hypothetical protein